MSKGNGIAYGLILSVVLAAPLAAQSADAGQLYATRADLEALLGNFANDSQESGYSDAIRGIATSEATLIRSRLRDGDFEVGDQITLSVSGQQALSTTFTVAPGRLLILPEIGAMPLGGLLRSELHDSTSAFIARYYKDPQVFVQTTMRLQAIGEIGNPGYHPVSAESRLPDVIAQIGQPTRDADLDGMTIKRGRETIWAGEALQEAIVQGRTMDQMSLRAGDVIEIPSSQKRNIGQMIRSLYYLVPLSFALIKLF